MTQYTGLARIYDELSEHDYVNWSKYILKLAGNKQKIVDAGCGTGSISIELAKLGYNVTAIDISEDMLNVATEKARKNGVKIAFSKQDMCKFTIHTPVDLVISTCDSINYITDPIKLNSAFRSAFDALRDGGMYIFDILSVNRMENTLGNSFFGADLEDIAYIWQNSFNKKSKILRMNITFFVKDGDKFSRITETHTQRAYSIEEIESKLKDVGFTNCKAYEAFTQNETKAENERICFVAVK